MKRLAFEQQNLLTYNMIRDNDFGSFKDATHEYIIVNCPPYYDSIYKTTNKKEFYKAIAVRLNDEIDEDGFAPAYIVKWKYPDKEAIPPDICQWDKPMEVIADGWYQVIEDTKNAI